ncbi:MAG: sigma-70 family RNA polymerase sigma factor [Nannocystaceae bacterium]
MAGGLARAVAARTTSARAWSRPASTRSTSCGPTISFLACACVHGDAVALQHSDRFALAPAVAALADAEERGPRRATATAARVRLLVRQHDAPPRIEQYGGRGSLRAWTRIAVLRAIKDERRTRSRRPHAAELADGLLDDAAVAADPELEQVRARHGAAFRAAFAAAVAQLDAESRRLLRQHHLHGLTLETVAAIYGIHRVTAARRLGRAREALLEATRAELVRRLQLDPGELAHAVAAMMSRLELASSVCSPAVTISTRAPAVSRPACAPARWCRSPYRRRPRGTGTASGRCCAAPR